LLISPKPVIMQKIIFEQPIYTFDIDFAHHVSNLVYVRWLEIGRGKLCDAIGLAVHELERFGYTPVLVETTIAYKRPMVLGDTATIELWLSDLQNISAVMQFRILNQRGELCAVATQRGLFVNLKTQKPHRLSKDDRAKFEPYLYTND
jgi:acyl-CoA thioester hydrolase